MNTYHKTMDNNHIPALPASSNDYGEQGYQNMKERITPWNNLPARVYVPPLSPWSENNYFMEEGATWVLPVVQNLSKTPRPSPEGERTEDSNSSIKKIVKNLAIYALSSSVASPLVLLVLSPFLTHHLSSTDYGALAILNTVIALVSGVTQLGLYAAFFRSYNYDYESQRDRLGILSTSVVLLSLISIPVTLAMIIGSPWLASFLLGHSSFGEAIGLTGFVILIQNLSIPGLAWLRAENRALISSLLSAANMLITLSMSILLVGFWHMGLSGALIATGAGYMIIVICLLPPILLRAGIHLRIDIAKGLLAFGLPNVLNTMSMWVLQLSDRYLLGHLGSLSQTASYAVAYALGGTLSTIVIAPFSLAWPSTVYTIAKKENAAQIFQLIFRWFCIILFLAGFVLSLLGTAVLNLLFPLSYHSASPIIAIVAESIIFYGLYSAFFTIGVCIQGRMWLTVVFTTTSALVNVGLNLVLIPLYGAMGAAASTLIAYILLAFVAYIVNQRLYPIPFEIGRIAIALFIGVALYLGSIYLAQSQRISMIWIGLCACLLYGVCLVFIGLLPGSGNDTRLMSIVEVKKLIFKKWMVKS